MSSKPLFLWAAPSISFRDRAGILYGSEAAGKTEPRRSFFRQVTRASPPERVASLPHLEFLRHENQGCGTRDKKNTGIKIGVLGLGLMKSGTFLLPRMILFRHSEQSLSCHPELFLRHPPTRSEDPSQKITPDCSRSSRFYAVETIARTRLVRGDRRNCP